ncbi:MAG: BrnT family toxin [Planctomycetes bacterium]|nr:BrnT family toxin [Planctomycetota bacterium]
MKFEWDEKKGEVNRLKHGVDFKTAVEIWQDEKRIEIQVPHPVEDRNVAIGQIRNKLWTAIYTLRGDAIRLISVRRARKEETRLYGKEEAG